MKNFRSDDDSVLNLVAPAGGVVSGVPIVIGGLLIVPHASAAEGNPFAGRYRGVFELPKVAADTPAQLAKAYWDGDAVTTAADDGADPAVAYPAVGVFENSAVAGSTVVNVLLTGELI